MSDETPTDADRIMAVLDELWQAGDGMILGKLHVRDDLIDMLEAARADAWDEGYREAYREVADSMEHEPTPSPYRVVKQGVDE